jgi:excisionase family DNA binding protein
MRLMSTLAAKPLLITVRQAAAALAVSERTIYNLLYSGQIDSVRVGTARRILAESLAAFVNGLPRVPGEAA